MRYYINIVLVVLFVYLGGVMISVSAQSTKQVELSLPISEDLISVDIVDENGEKVEIPQVFLQSTRSSYMQQTTTGTLGVPHEKIRLSNPTKTSVWTVSIAATDGEDALWTDLNGNTFDYNDPEALSGQLTIDPSHGNIARGDTENGFIVGISLGERASFIHGIVNSITLYSADATADPFAQYDLMNVELSQVMPSGQAPGVYTMNLTITAL